MSLSSIQVELAHEPIVRRLWRLWRCDRLPQTLLMAGPDREVIRASVFRWVQAVMCEAAQTRPDPCRHCGPCRRIAKGQCPDVIWDTPPDETAVWGIETVRTWGERLALTPYESDRIVLVVEEAHRLSLHAANAFLKTLEEPSRHAMIILITEAPEKLLPTIRSRCSPVRVPLLTRPHAARLLCDRGMTARDAVVAAGLREGSVDVTTREDIASWFRLRNQIIDNRKAAVNNDDIVKNVAADAAATRRLLWLMLTLVRDVWVARAGAGGRHWIHVDRGDTVARKAAAPTEAVETLTQDVMDAFRQFQQQLNVKIPLHLILEQLWTM